MAAVGTGPIITKLTPDLDLGSVPQWHVFHVDGQAWDFSEEPTEEAVLMAMPVGTYIVDATICCTKAAAATGTDTIDLRESSADRKLVTGTSDNGGVIDTMDRTLVIDASAYPIATACNLEVLRTISADTGSDTTGGAEYQVAVLMFRVGR